MLKPNKNMIKLPRPNYYQGILQLRNVNDEVLNFVRNQVEKRDGVFITKTVKLDNGVDLYITSQYFIRILGKKLKESFGGELKISSKLHTRSRTGKDLYRINALFRPVPFKRGDIVVVRGDEVKLLAVGRRIFARDLKTGKRIRVRSSDLRKE